MVGFANYHQGANLSSVKGRRMGVNRKIELPSNTMKSDLEENLKIFHHKETHHWIFMTV